MIQGFLASSYASRGLKMRFTSGSRLKCRWATQKANPCFIWKRAASYITKAASVQGLQNGSVSCIGVPSADAVRAFRAVLAEKPDLFVAGSGSAPPVTTRPSPT